MIPVSMLRGKTSIREVGSVGSRDEGVLLKKREEKEKEGRRDDSGGGGACGIVSVRGDGVGIWSQWDVGVSMRLVLGDVI
jgi:hypothetical protein